MEKVSFTNTAGFTLKKVKILSQKLYTFGGVSSRIKYLSTRLVEPCKTDSFIKRTSRFVSKASLATTCCYGSFTIDGHRFF